MIRTLIVRVVDCRHSSNWVYSKLINSTSNEENGWVRVLFKISEWFFIEKYHRKLQNIGKMTSHDFSIFLAAVADAATSAVVAVRSVAARRKLLSFCFPDLDPFLSVEILPLKRLTATRLAPCGDRLQITRYHNQWDQKKLPNVYKRCPKWFH